MASSQKPRLSNNSLTVDAPITVYSNSPELNALNPNYVRVIPANVVSAIVNGYDASEALNADGSADEIDITITEDTTSDGKTDTSESSGSASGDTVTVVAPRLSDVSLVSTQVVYDAAGIPSITAIFKVKNTSTKLIKGINARVQSI